MKKLILNVIWVLSFLFARFSFADLVITEIMYDPEGTDNNYEWVEIYNKGNDLIEASDWYFYENETFHKISSSKIGSGEYFLLAKDPDMLLDSFGDVVILKSSFSLNNSGEEIAIANSSKEIVDSYTYSSEEGANGNSQSLQKTSSSWVHANPTPGEENEYSSVDINNSSVVKIYSASSKKKKEAIRLEKFDPYYKLSLDIDELIFARSNFIFSVLAEYVTPQKIRTKKDGYFYINFGDGFSREFFEAPKEQHYHYRKPGTYNFNCEYYTSYFAYEKGAEPEFVLGKKLHVYDSKIVIDRISYSDGVVIKNNSSQKVNISSYRLFDGIHSFVFPKNSYIYPNSEISIFVDILGFDPIFSKKSLYLESDLSAHMSVYHWSSSKTILKTSTKKDNEGDLLLGEIDEKEIFDSFKKDNDTFFENESDLSEIDLYLKNNPDKIKVDFGEESFNTYQKDTSSQNNNILIYAIASLVVMFGIVRFTYHHNEKEKKLDEEDVGDLGEIELIE